MSDISHGNLILRALDASALRALRVEAGQVIEIVDWSRPDLFEAFGLPMTFPASDRYNQHKVNPKEVP